MASSGAPRISALDIAQVEAWALSSFPHRAGEASIVVHGRGGHIHVEEQRPRPEGGVSSRTIVRFRFVDKTGNWLVHRAVAGGRWIGRQPVEGPLSEVLDGVDLRDLPAGW